MAYTSINKSTDHFNTLTYSGTGGNGTTTTQAITGANFRPDLVWLKQRSSTQQHQICDSIRGANNLIATNSTNAEVADTQIINSFDSDGFTAGYQDQANDIGQTYVSWLWKAGGATGVSNTDGSITSTVSANTTAGFSIVKWTGSGSNAQIGHGLNAVPKWIWIKSLDNTTWHMVYHAGIGNDSELGLNSTNSASSSSTAWQDTTPTSSVFYVSGSSGDGVNYSGDYIAYCWAEKKGFSKFGSYQGNSSSDGVFCYLGFKPSLVIIKQATGGNANEVWSIRDNKRDTFNPITKTLIANANSAEGTTSTHYVDFVSNGFKIRTGTENALNTNYGYIYMAFAEAPLVGSNNVPCTAR